MHIQAVHSLTFSIRFVFAQATTTAFHVHVLQKLIALNKGSQDETLNLNQISHRLFYVGGRITDYIQ